MSTGGAHHITGQGVAESQADYGARRTSLLSPSDAAPVDGRTSHRDHLAAGLSLIGIVAEIAWATTAVAQRLSPVAGWSIAAAILFVLLATYRLISTRRSH